MNYEIAGRKSTKRRFLESIMPSMLRQLGLDKRRGSILVSFQTDCKDAGITVPIPGANMYLVALNPKSAPDALGITLAHELVHVAQMSRGTLRNSARGATVWAGVRYPKSTPYLDRPWEIQAFAKQELLLRRALDEL